MKIINPFSVTDTSLTSSSVVEDDYAEWDSGTSYNIGDRVIRAATHKIYESLVASNLNNIPEDSLTGVTPEWLEVSATNRWAMFDQVWSSQTSTTSPLTVVLTPGESVDSIALLNLDATSVQVAMTSGGSTVYDNTLSTLGGEALATWYDYFFLPITQRTDLVALDLPPYKNGVITVTISNTSGSVKCGQCIVGMKTQLGLSQYNASTSITDYSIKSTDSFGNTSITQRKYSKRMEIQLQVDNGLVDYVSTTLAAYRSTPLVWVGADNLYSMLIVFGYYRDFDINIAYHSISYCSLTIEGLT